MTSLLALGFPLAVVLKATLVLAAAAAATLVLRQRGASAAARHLVWTLAVLAVLAIPLFTLALPQWPVRMLSAPDAAALSAEPTFRLSEPAVTAAAPAAAPVADDGAVVTPYSSGATRTAPEAARPAFAPALLLPLLYLAGVLAVLLRLVVGRWSVARTARRAQELADPEWAGLLRDLRWMLGISRPVRLLRGEGATMPMTWGVLRARVLLPAEAASWSPERRRVVLLHELAHVARYDCLIQTLATLACALYWFHPGAWYAARRLRVERELACDDRVLEAGTRAREYAEHLLEVARGFRPALLAAPVAVSMARPSQLEGRLLAVLDGLRNRAVPTRRAAAAGGLAALLLVLPLAALHPAAAQLRAQASADSVPRQERVKHKPPRSVDAYPDLEAAMAAGVYDRAFAARPGGKLTLRLPRNVTARVQGWDRATVHLRVDDPALRVSAGAVAGGVRVVVGGTRSREGDGPAVRILVPQRYDVDVGADDGGVEIRDLAGRFTGSTRGGGLAFVNARGTVQMDGGDGGAFISHSHLDGRLDMHGGGALVDGNQGGLSVVGSAVVRGSVDEISALGRQVQSIFSGGADRAAAQAAQRGDVVAIAKPGGDIQVRAAPAGANLSTGGGDIVLGSAGGTVHASTGGGDVILRQVDGSAHVSTGAGDVSVQLVGDGGDVRMSSGNGVVTLTLPADFSGTLELESAWTRGHPRTRIISDFPLAISETQDWDFEHGDPRRFVRGRARLGSGGHSVRVSTVNGDVRLVRGGGGDGALVDPTVRSTVPGATVACTGDDCTISTAGSRDASEPAVVTGRIVDGAGEPVGGVLVRIIALQLGATSRADGRYMLVVPVQRMGSTPREVTVSTRLAGYRDAAQTVVLEPSAHLERNFTLRRQEVSAAPRGDTREVRVSDALGFAYVTGDAEGRVASVWALARSAPAAAAALGLGRLAFNDADAAVQRASVQALGTLPSADAAEALRRVAREHPAAAIRSLAAELMRAPR